MTYTRSHIIFHWLTFGLVLALAGSGLAYSYEWADKGAILFHQYAGQALILVVVGRVISRVGVRPDPAPLEGPVWERKLAQIVHGALYLCLFIYVATGYVSASALRDNALLAPLDLVFARSDIGETLLEIHFALKWVLLGLLGLHVLGAAKHALLDRPSTVSNMLSLSQPKGS